MNIKLKGSGNGWHFVDVDTGDNYGSYCPICNVILRPASMAYPYSMYRHTLSKKHIRNVGTQKIQNKEPTEKSIE